MVVLGERGNGGWSTRDCHSLDNMSRGWGWGRGGGGKGKVEKKNG